MKKTILLACMVLATAACAVEVPTVAEVVKGDLAFSEGPAWDGARYLYFSDIPRNQILRHDTDTGTTEVFIEDTGGANGLLVAPDGALYACEGQRRALVRYLLPAKERQVVFEKSGGHRVNSPNDLWMDASGGIYVTDPVYGAVENREIETEDVHYIAPGAEEAVTAATGLVRPNGIVGTPDGKILYVADHGDAKVYAYDITGPGKLDHRRLFVAHASDGMALDAQNNLYITDGKTVRAFDPEGNALDAIPFPDQTTNVTFGGPEGRTLFITCANSLFSLEIEAKE